MENKTKTCTICGIEKDVSAFAKNRRQCRGCMSARSKAWDAAHPGSAQERRRRHYVDNREKELEQCALWRDSNRDRISETSKARYYATVPYQQERKRRYYELNLDMERARSRAYRLGHIVIANERSRQWAKDNPDRHRAHRARRRAQELLATPVWADLAEMESIYAKARALEEETGKRFHVDHIVPLQHELVCGLHCPANLQPIEAFANRSKGNRFWPDMP